eukprot:3771371-Pleurochrysis_carterae.AAC.1
MQLQNELARQSVLNVHAKPTQVHVVEKSRMPPPKRTLHANKEAFAHFVQAGFGAQLRQEFGIRDSGLIVSGTTRKRSFPLNRHSIALGLDKFRYAGPSITNAFYMIAFAEFHLVFTS